MEDEELEVEEIEEIESDKTQIHKVIQTIVIPKNERMFLDAFSLTEYVSVITTRAKQIEDGFVPFVPHRISAVQTAICELLNKKCPLTIVRPRIDFIGYNDKIQYVEYWEANELQIPEKCISNDRELIDLNQKINLDKFMEEYKK